jgi:hypothetical protein
LPLPSIRSLRQSASKRSAPASGAASLYSWSDDDASATNDERRRGRAKDEAIAQKYSVPPAPPEDVPCSMADEVQTREGSSPLSAWEWHYRRLLPASSTPRQLVHLIRVFVASRDCLAPARDKEGTQPKPDGGDVEHDENTNRNDGGRCVRKRHLMLDLHGHRDIFKQRSELEWQPSNHCRSAKLRAPQFELAPRHGEHVRV